MRSPQPKKFTYDNFHVTSYAEGLYPFLGYLMPDLNRRPSVVNTHDQMC